MPLTKREYLAVPYDQRHLARVAGARWDATAKAWYVGDQGDREALGRWLPGAGQPAIPPRDEFTAAMHEHGLLVIGAHPIADGSAHRVPVEGDRHDAMGRYRRPSGQYALHLDGHPAGFLKNFRRGTYANWKSSGFSLPPAEMAALRAEAAQRERERAAERERAIEAAASRVQAQAASLRPASAPTGYMKLKGIAPTIGALTDRAGVTTYLPAIDVDGKQWTMQTIRRDGFKLFEEDSRKEGTFHIVGADMSALEGLPRLVMAEGYATAAIVAEAASQPILAAFDAGNLVPVAVALRRRFPDKPILIAGDDDRGVAISEGHNPGRDKAGAAAVAVDGLAVFPQFAGGEVESDPKRFTDFHDLATASVLGRPAVREQILAGIALLMRDPPADAAGEKKESDMAETEPGSEGAAELAASEDRDRRIDAAADTAPNRIAAAFSSDGPDRTSAAQSGRNGPSIDVADVPAAVTARYLVETSRWTGHRAYFEGGRTQVAAFHDSGARLASQSDSPAVIADMVAIARHRQWETLAVSGTDAFRREAWLRAREAGLAVTGYQPSERDLQEVARQGDRARPAPEQAAAPAPKGEPAREAEQTRVYLSVPFAEKDAAKAAGARWDGRAKAWYADEDRRAAIGHWVPSEGQARSEKMIATDPNARAQLRAIEAVVGATLADNPDAQRRMLDAGRERLAERLADDRSVPAPQLQADGKTRQAAEPAVPATRAGEPALPHRRPPERTRGR